MDTAPQAIHTTRDIPTEPVLGESEAFTTLCSSIPSLEPRCLSPDPTVFLSYRLLIKTHLDQRSAGEGNLARNPFLFLFSFFVQKVSFKNRFASALKIRFISFYDKNSMNYEVFDLEKCLKIEEFSVSFFKPFFKIHFLLLKLIDSKSYRLLK